MDMELLIQLGIGAAVAILFIDKFVQYAKIVKNKNGNGRRYHTTPCDRLLDLDEKFNKYCLEEAKRMALLERIDERTLNIQKQLKENNE